jgi:hypothetical protein
MVKGNPFCFVLVFAGIIAAPGIGAKNVLAAGDCITEPNQIPPKGSRWQYHSDRATNRKCWHIAVVTPSHTRYMPVRSAPELTVRRDKHQLSESEQAALFSEFLRWKERQSVTNGGL